jgi:pyridoxamine 5'-phosphate oxidase
MTAELAAMRVSDEQKALDESDLAATWHEQLPRWLGEAIRAGLAEPNAMVLATADRDGRPSSRTVLCKAVDARGVVFFTNYSSAKSDDLLATGWASATFPWLAMQRQAHLRGPAEKVPQPRGPPIGPSARLVPSSARGRPPRRRW